MKAGACFSSRRNGPLPLCPNRTPPLVLYFTSSAQQVGDGWIFHSQVSVVNLQCPRSLRPFSVGCAGFRTRPRLFMGGGSSEGASPESRGHALRDFKSQISNGKSEI
jgi:hypothetical protein